MSTSDTKQLRHIGHNLKPVVTVGDKGLTESVITEIKRALDDHELIKITVRTPDRDDKKAMIADICKKTQSELIQTIGHIALIYKASNQPDPRLSNILRNL